MESANQPGTRSLECYCMGSIHSVLVQGSWKAGTVMNVFERTINVRTVQGELLTITLDRTRSPANLNVSAWHGSRAVFSGLAREGQDVVVSRAGRHTVLHVGGVAVSIDKPDIFRCSLREPVAGFLHTFAAELESISSALVAGAEKRRGCLLNPDMTTEGLLAAFLNCLGTQDAGNQHAVAEALVGLCGRGPGFTPAGDDFIAGYLAAYNWLGQVLKQWPAIIPGLELSRLTTWTSFKLIEYAARDLLDEQAQAMLNSAAVGNVADYALYLETIGRRGHTSGMDFATGATVGLCAVADWVFGMGALGRISSILIRRPAQLS